MIAGCLTPRGGRHGLRIHAAVAAELIHRWGRSGGLEDEDAAPAVFFDGSSNEVPDAKELRETSM